MDVIASINIIYYLMTYFKSFYIYFHLYIYLYIYNINNIMR